MKKISLFMVLTMLGMLSFGQVIFQIQAPSTPAGLQNTTYPLTWADPGGGDWATPDLNIPANSVTAALEFVDDGDAPTPDANGNPLSQNACTGTGAANFTQPSLVGKIAVLYRGDCQFGHKAAAAENAGAVGVIIINHTGAPVGMAGGDSGLVVTIPVIMISEQDGDFLKADIAAGTITQAFIGNKFGIFTDDLGSRKGDVLRSRRFSNLAPLSQNASEFSVPVGAWVRNFGSATQSNAQLKCVIDNGSVIYQDSAVVPTIASGDSTFVALSTFSQSSYSTGLYNMNYTITTNPTTDGEPSDNVIDVSFMISDSLYSLSRLDPVTFVPESPQGFTSGSFTSDWEFCTVFQDPNASRMMSMGMTVSNTTSSTEVLTNSFFEVRVYEWNDVFTDINDAGLAFSNLNLLDAAFFVYTSDLQDIPVFVAHNNPIGLVDNTRYLFCLNTSAQVNGVGDPLSIFAGFDSEVDYTTTQDDGPNGGHLQPTTVLAVDGTYSLDGFSPDFLGNVLATSVRMDLNTIGVDELDNEILISPYPNPTTNALNIPVGDRNGKATIELFDIAGKLIVSKNVRFNNNEVLKLDVSKINNGSYIGKMTFNDGTTAKFSVVISK
jgi:hypothetical protein